MRLNNFLRHCCFAGLYALPTIIRDPLAPKRRSRLEPRAVGQVGTFLCWVQSLYSLCGPHSSPLHCLLFGVPVLDRSTEEGKSCTFLISGASHQLEFFFFFLRKPANFKEFTNQDSLDVQDGSLFLHEYMRIFLPSTEDFFELVMISCVSSWYAGSCKMPKASKLEKGESIIIR